MLIDHCYLFMKHLTDALTVDQIFEQIQIQQLTHDQINVQFSGEQLVQLYTLVDNKTLTIHDVMIAYIILTLNTQCFENIEHTNTIVNFRGVSDSIASAGLIANCTLRMLLENFNDPYCLLSIAKDIRHSIIRSRDPSFVEPLLSTADELMRDLANDGRQVNVDHFPHGIVVNSNYRYDWANLVHFGFPDKCRFHTDGTSPLFLRIFRLNPIFDGTHWITRDRQGAKVTFRIEKKFKQKFVDAWQRDVKENFLRVKK